MAQVSAILQSRHAANVQSSRGNHLTQTALMRPKEGDSQIKVRSNNPAIRVLPLGSLLQLFSCQLTAGCHAHIRACTWGLSLLHWGTRI
eukprot:scaffold284978_cov18-Tisochrysis_lutea.AAC.1